MCHFIFEKAGVIAALEEESIKNESCFKFMTTTVKTYPYMDNIAKCCVGFILAGYHSQFHALIREDIVEKRLPWPRPGTLGKLGSAAGPYKKGPPFCKADPFPQFRFRR